jgi:hypothetical protein
MQPAPTIGEMEISMRIKTAVLVAASCLLLGAAPAFAQSAEDVEKAPPAAAAAAKVKAKAKKKAAPKGKNAGDVTVVNARGDVVASVAFTNAQGKVVASVKKPLAPGKKTVVKLMGGCDFTVSARFADGSDFEPTALNLCADKTIRFTDGEGVPASADPGPTGEE